MITPRPSFWCAAAVLALAAPAFAAAQAGGSIDQAEIAAMPAQRLAERLLGPERAADVESARLDRDPLLGMLTGVRFFHRPRSLDLDVCGRTVDHVSLQPAAPIDPRTDRSQVPLRAAGVSQGLQIALAAGCRIPAGQAFATVNPGTQADEAIGALRNLATVIALARADRPLAFPLSCHDELGQGGCRDEGRAALAGLRTEQAWLIGPEGRSVIVGEPGQVYWEIRFTGYGTTQASVTMLRKAPAPF